MEPTPHGVIQNIKAMIIEMKIADYEEKCKCQNSKKLCQEVTKPPEDSYPGKNRSMHGKGAPSLASALPHFSKHVTPRFTHDHGSQKRVINEHGAEL